ncbi:MAG: hypothetical protein QM498_00420 [Desulfobacterium sp.]
MKKEYPGIELETIEVAYGFKRAWKDGVRIFPALKINDDILSGVILTRRAVRKFVEKHLTGKPSLWNG